MFFSSNSNTPHDILQESYQLLTQMLTEQDFNKRAHYFAFFTLLKDWDSLKESHSKLFLTLQSYVNRLMNHSNFNFLEEVDSNLPMALALIIQDEWDLPPDFAKEFGCKTDKNFGALGWLEQQARNAGALFTDIRHLLIHHQHEERYQNIAYLVQRGSRFNAASVPIKVIPAAVNNQQELIDTVEQWQATLTKPAQRVIVGDAGILPLALAKHFTHDPETWFLHIPLANIAQLNSDASIGELLQFCYFPKTLNSSLFALEQHVWENNLFAALQSGVRFGKSQCILFLEGYLGMGNHLTPLLKELLLFPNVILSAPAADLKLLRQQGVLENAIEFSLTGLNDKDIIAYVANFFAEKSGRSVKKGVSLCKMVENNPYLRTLLKQPENLELACLAYDATLEEITSFSQLYNALLRQFVTAYEVWSHVALPTSSLQYINNFISECSGVAYTTFIHGTLQVSAEPEQCTYWVNTGLLKASSSPTTSSLSFTFATSSLQAYLAAYFIHQHTIDVLEMKSINFGMLVAVSRFLIHFWVDNKDKLALEKFFNTLLTRQHASTIGSRCDIQLLQSTWEEFTYTIAARAYTAGRSSQTFLCLSTELTEKIVDALEKANQAHRELVGKNPINHPLLEHVTTETPANVTSPSKKRYC